MHSCHVDYLSSEIPDSVFLPPKDTITCFVFPAIVDNRLALEPDRSFFLRINDTLPNDPSRIALDIKEVEIVIVDDDGTYIDVSTVTK